MLSLPLSFGLAALALTAPVEQLSPAERAKWSRIEPSVAYILRGNVPVGVAALVEADGTFVAHRTALRSDVTTARLANGTSLELHLKAADPTTQLALLKASSWAGSAKPLKAVAGAPKPGEKLIAALPSGTIRAEYVSGSRLGVVGQTRRMLPMSELRFEAPSASVGGALVLNLEGQIVGFLAATLDERENTQAQVRAPVSKSAGARREMSDAQGAPMSALAAPQQQAFGPADMAVAYSVAPGFLRRALQGLTSGHGHVEYPTIGVMCVDSKEGGALVTEVVAGLSAEKAGIKPGDIIFRIGGYMTADQIDVARAILTQEIGAELKVLFKRGGNLRSVLVRVESQAHPGRDNPESATSG